MIPFGIVFYLMFLPFFVKLFLGSYKLVFIRLIKLSPVDWRVHKCLVLFFFMFLFFVCLVLGCFLLHLCLFDVLFRILDRSIFVCLVLSWCIDSCRCCIFGWMGRICLFVWIFFRTILLCILSFVWVCRGLFFVVLVPIFCF